MKTCENPCYDCQNKWTTHRCENEGEKYKRLKASIARAKAEYGDNKFWINIDFEREDEVAMRAFKRVLRELEADGYKYGEPTYKRYCLEGWLECGYHTGTLYVKR